MSGIIGERGDDSGGVGRNQVVARALERAVQREETPVELISCPFCAWRYAGLAGGRRHREALDEHLATAHGGVPGEERQRRTLERERCGQLVAPYLPLGSK